MEVFLIFLNHHKHRKNSRMSWQSFMQSKHSKYILKLPCSTEQKLELVDAVVKHIKSQT